MAQTRTTAHRIKQGLRLPISGAPALQISPGPEIESVALAAADYPDMRPRLKVNEGDRVDRGQALFEDRKTKGVVYTSPGAGTIAAVHRGARRAFESIVIDLDESERSGASAPREILYNAFLEQPVDRLSAEQVRDLLVESGLWTALRRRPYDNVPATDTRPESIFVTAVDTNPLAPLPDAVLSGNEALLTAGLGALARLVSGGRVYLCTGPEAKIGVDEINGVERHTFGGPHPAGNPGLHMHLVAPVSPERPAWHVGYQDVVAMGHLFLTGRLLVDRVVSLAGPRVETPRLLKTRIGASVTQLIHGNLAPGANRVISGSVFNGRSASRAETSYLGRYHNQITVLEEANERRPFGWLAPGIDRFSAFGLFLSKLLPARDLDLTTDANGQPRVLVPLGMYEKVFPFDLLATPLVRALLSKDDEQAEALGCLELAEEDLALCSFVCPSKIDFGQSLRAALRRIEEQA